MFCFSFDSGFRRCSRLSPSCGSFCVCVCVCPCIPRSRSCCCCCSGNKECTSGEVLLGCSEWGSPSPSPPSDPPSHHHHPVPLEPSSLYNIIQPPFPSLFASCLASVSPFSPPSPPPPPSISSMCVCVCVCAHSRAWFMYLSTSSSSPFHPTFAIPQQPLDGGGGGKPTAATRRWNWRRNFYLIPT